MDIQILWPQHHEGRPFASHVDRRHLLGVFDNETFRVSMVVIGVVIAVAVLALAIWAFVTKCGRQKSARVGQGDFQDGDVEQNNRSGAEPQPVKSVRGAPLARTPVPPWQNDPARLPPGVVLAPVTPPKYDLKVRPRQPTDPPYERLALVSSRVHNAEKVAASMLPNVAYVVYDWKNYTLQELLLHVKKVLGAQKVTSIAVVAPGSKPGSVALLEGCGTSAEKLSSQPSSDGSPRKTEVRGFWRALAACLEPHSPPQTAQAAATGGGTQSANGAALAASKGSRIDLLGCRVAEAPDEGLALMKDLSELTEVPVAAADDAQAGYRLFTYEQDPTTKRLGMAQLDIVAMDLYFNREMLLGISASGGGGGGAAAAPAAPAVAETVAKSAAPPPPPPSRASPPAAPPPATPPIAVAAGPAAAAAPDIFTRLDAAMRARGKTAEPVFDEHDRDRNGQLSTDELTELMKALVPDATAMDIKHFQAMLDTDAQESEKQECLSRSEFVNGIRENIEIQKAVRERRDDDDVIGRLREYLAENKEPLQTAYKHYDASGNGLLEHNELKDLINDIPGLEQREKKYALAYLFHYDQNRDLRISLDELIFALGLFSKDAPTGESTAAQTASPAGSGGTTAPEVAASTSAGGGAAPAAAEAASMAASEASAAPVAAETGRTTEAEGEASPAGVDDAAEASAPLSQQPAAPLAGALNGPLPSRPNALQPLEALIPGGGPRPDPFARPKSLFGEAPKRALSK